MLVSSILALLVGIPLGFRFKVMILAPASLGALLLVICVALVRADTPLNIGLSAAAAIACLQVGYVAGIVMLSRLASNRPDQLPRFAAPSAGARRAAQKSHAQSDVDLVTCRQDDLNAYANEEFV